MNESADLETLELAYDAMDKLNTRQKGWFFETVRRCFFFFAFS